MRKAKPERKKAAEGPSCLEAASEERTMGAEMMAMRRARPDFLTDGISSVTAVIPGYASFCVYGRSPW